jgi:hypothetical protein
MGGGRVVFGVCAQIGKWRERGGTQRQDGYPKDGAGSGWCDHAIGAKH